MTPSACPCGSGLAFSRCCGPRIDDASPAPTAEALMRSRYTAYVLADAAYLLATWHPATQPESLQLDEEPQARWIGLTVKRHEVQDEEHAVVEFVARYKIGGRAFKLHETSRFVRENGRWYYVEGEIAA